MNEHINHPDLERRISALLKKREVCVREHEDALENIAAIDHEIAQLKATRDARVGE